MKLQMQLFDPIVSAGPSPSDARRREQTRPLLLLLDVRCVHLARQALLAGLQPEPYRVLIRKVELNQLPVDELVAQELHAEVEFF